MDERQGYVRLGIFVSVAVAALLGVLFILVGRSMLKPTLVIETYFNQSVAGLELGAPVNFRGVPVGQVSDILLSAVTYERGVPLENRRAYIVVRAKLSGPDALLEQWRTEIQDYVARGLRAQTQLAGITGQLYLVLDYFDPERYPPLPFDWTPKDPYIPSAQSLTGELIAKAQEFLASLNEAGIRELGTNLNRLIVTLDHKLDQLPIETLSGEMVALMADSRALVKRLDQTLAEAPIAQAMRRFASASKRVDDLLADPSFGRTLHNAEDFSARLKAIAEGDALARTLTNLDQTLQRVDALVGDNQYDVRVIVADLRVTAANLRALSERAKRDPAGFFIGGPRQGAEFPWSKGK
ncbi:MlaD family protein [Thiocystis violacea]|uniref:MlaD family protein n=1 Tax=Thiocystis violacea TaxID=13725 RepID=UPI001904ED74|nr:MlaD family protein [Thiocystis violacea]MBK1723878.1 hypothetical protein [Thiocystis violacea]